MDMMRLNSVFLKKDPILSTKNLAGSYFCESSILKHFTATYFCKVNKNSQKFIPAKISNNKLCWKWADVI